MKVITINGKTTSKSNCRGFKENGVTKYYLIGDIKKEHSGDVFYFPFKEPKGAKKGNYIRLCSGKIFYDHQIKSYRRKSEVNCIINGVVGFTEDYEPIQGNFSCEDLDSLKQYYHPKQGSIYLMNDKLIQEGNLTYTTGQGRPYYINESMFTKGRLTQFKTPYRGKLRFDSKLLNSSINTYGADGNSLFKVFVQKYNDTVVPNLDSNKSLETFARFLNNYTFGLEIETCAGLIPEDFLIDNAIVPVKDGSVQAHEYITVPLQGVSGLNYINKIFEQFEQHTRADQMCSLHIHMGNTGEKTREFTAAFYTLYYRIQNELKDFLPPYKKANQYIKSKDGAKDHCKYLPNLLPYGANEYTSEHINAVSDNVYAFFNEGYLSEDSNFDDPRYIGNNKNKWNQLARYYVVNLVPYFFKPQQTIEFRFHSGTVNRTKTLAWLFICSATLSYARAYPEKILSMNSKITLSDVINGFKNNFGQDEEITPEGKFLADYLNDYIFKRKYEFIQQTIRNLNREDIQDIYISEFKKDHEFTFKHEEQDLLTYGEK